MYVDQESIDRATLYQGDIISNFPFYLLDSGQPIKKNKAGRFELGEDDKKDRALFAVEARKQNVMILSQTCDLQRRKNVMICPIYNLKEYIKDNAINKDTASSIRERKIYYMFYLPQYKEFPESLADLQTIIYVPRTKVEECAQQTIVRLSDLGRHHLSWSLTAFFGRPAERK